LQKEKIKLFSTFTGIGSPEMAMRNIGLDFEVVGISEVDKWALQAYDAIHCENIEEPEYPSKEEMKKYFLEKNIAYNCSTGKSEMPRNERDLQRLYKAHKRSKNYGDIRLIDEHNLPEFNFFTYSFPCNNISVAGKQAGLEEGSKTQSSLLWECKRLIEVNKPKYLLMENVKNLVGKKFKPLLELWIATLDELGYKSSYKVLNGKDFGVPQNRERVMMISTLGVEEDYIFPDKKPLTICLHDVLEPEVDEKYYINPEKYKHITDALPSQEISYCIDANYHKGISVDQYILKRRRKLVQVGNLENKIHSNTRVYSEEGLSPTLNSMNGGSRQLKILVDGCAIRGRNPNGENTPTEQMLEINKLEGVSNSITTVGKDSLVCETSYGVRIVGRNPDNPKSRVKGIPTVQMLELNKDPDICNTLSTVQKDSVVAQYVPDRVIIDDTMGFDKDENGNKIPRVYNNVAPALRGMRSGLKTVTREMRVRKLTPLECWRLMGYTDEDFQKTRDNGSLANTKLYERAGRGIVVPMLEDLIHNLFIQK
jgi:DNA (cytosine-5)-methyltransferase 1